MHIDALPHDIGLLPNADQPVARRQPNLTAYEFLQLGLYRVAYLTQVTDDEGAGNVVMHGADGMAIAAVETPALAAELAEQLGLYLLPVH